MNQPEISFKLLEFVLGALLGCFAMAVFAYFAARTAKPHPLFVARKMLDDEGRRLGIKGLTLFEAMITEQPFQSMTTANPHEWLLSNGGTLVNATTFQFVAFHRLMINDQYRLK